MSCITAQLAGRGGWEPVEVVETTNTSRLFLRSLWWTWGLVLSCWWSRLNPSLSWTTLESRDFSFPTEITKSLYTYTVSGSIWWRSPCFLQSSEQNLEDSMTTEMRGQSGTGVFWNPTTRWQHILHIVPVINVRCPAPHGACLWRILIKLFWIESFCPLTCVFYCWICRSKTNWSQNVME